ncbi:PREDICTED: acetyl-coenzyme A synthetase 2-like, mitochondrial isoform X2 [Branchiostoma belcheri]|uniref:Acetyl-coenzyme A synthetase n=1 Tax=Branchiostoma belcheri TaxID=7741 RepID=A0A6P4YMV6_BRABE|nr:PREDICTED: acetyl-coenzyme A synthetase 2-like, mitochondrial isoform X1 [Branchiostoma belcheri]XP_019630801.1 PREDICTED: acetyl-coenzyme A synthetase 2-like, mitochondrial isoform X2 [Branchiostoma belcheri]KAI8484374.1 Acetyl-coenzyme A synthetase 2-like, mitochondrial [Branchiostoma belcheri]
MAAALARVLDRAVRLSFPIRIRVFPAARFSQHTVARCLSTTPAKKAVETTTPMPEADGFPGVRTHQDLYEFSLREPDTFWGTLAKSRLQWFRSFDRVSDCDMSEGRIKWFLGGQLNVSVNTLDRHAQKTPDKAALIWERDEPGSEVRVTYRELLAMTCQLANTLKSHGVKKGDRVCIYMPNSPIAVAAMQACARIGAPHSVVFAGFSADALASRIQDANCETVITTDQAVRGGKVIELKKTVDAAVANCPMVKRVLVAQRTGQEVPMKHNLDFPLEEEMSSQSSECAPEIMDSEDPLFMLYTSGSTGKPKGILHTQAGYLLYATMTSKFAFDIREDDIFSCVADIGWITGHSYVVYGPLSNGATTVLFESIPTYPNPGRYWEMVERLKINQFYLAPTAVRLLLKFDESWVKKYDRSTLRKLGCVGEPLNVEAGDWYNNVVGEGRCDLVDTWWQTETGGIMITPRPSQPGAEILHGPMRPFFGIEPVLFNDEPGPEQGKELPGTEVSGALCVRKPWPGIARTIFGDHERYLDTYFRPYPGTYFSGDGAHRDHKGYYHITGRMDDVINISGHRIGTAEIEDAMDEHRDVAETAVIGTPHDVKGEVPYAFVILKEGVRRDEEDIAKELKDLVRKSIAAYAVPDTILITPGLPKTRSGKIMRRILRKISTDKEEELGDVSTLAEPSVVDAIVQSHKAYKQRTTS